MTRDVVFLVFPAFEILDLTGPLAAFQAANAVRERYTTAVVSQTGGLVMSTEGLAVATAAMDRGAIDTLMVVGGEGSRMVDAPFLGLVRHASARARRTASVCTGAFVLAAAGLLDGRCATTHWRHTGALQRRYPAVRVNGERIFIKDGAVWSSAGITAGIDLALAMIEEDFGIEVSRAVARDLVVYHRRPGGQSQFSALLDLEPESDRVRRALTFARDHLADPLPVERLAQEACLSVRHFARAFRRETGETPAKAVERLRAEAARIRIEHAHEPIEAVARSVGFSDPERMRRAFLRLFGQPPQAIKRLARSRTVP